MPSRHPAAVVGALDLLVVLDLRRLPLPHRRDLAHLVLVHPRALDARRRRRRGAEQEHVALADEPLGALLVEDHAAVGGARHREREAGRHVGLDDAGDDVDRRALGGDDEVDADGAGHLGDAADRVLDVARRHHHEVGQLVDHHEDERQARERAHDLAARRHVVGQVAAVVGGVVAGDVAEADLGEQVVAALHLPHRPGQRVGGLLRVGDHLGEQVRQPVVLPHLDPLGVDEDHAHLVGRRAHEDRGDDRVEAARLARAGGARR